MTGPVRLFCLPYAGGSAARIYRDWGRQLPAWIKVMPVELPGRGDRIAQPPIPSAAVLTADALRQVLPHTGEPFALFGHSLGAALVFEMARKLEQGHGRPPVHLFVSGFDPPDLPREPDADYLLPEPQFRERLAELSGTDREVLANEDLMDLLSPVLRADFTAIGQWRYTEGPPLSCPITVFSGLSDPEVTVPSLAGWGRQTTGSCQVRLLPGNHFVINDAPGLLLPFIASQLESTGRATVQERSR